MSNSLQQDGVSTRSSHSGSVVVDEQVRKLIANAHIMMVDDESLNMDVLQVHLEDEGYHRFSAISDSTQAMDCIRAETPDVLLLDLVMPEVSGFDILKMVRSDTNLSQLPVIVLTSATDAATKHEALQLGATDFLAKPIDASELALRMRNTLTARAWQRRVNQTDVLTGLPNRLFFTQALRQRHELCLSTDERSALVLININRFKSVNDSLGPALGDQVLQAFTERLCSVYQHDEDQTWGDIAGNRALPIVARLDGDRFSVLLPFAEDEHHSELLDSSINDLLTKMQKPMTVAGQKLYLNISIGVAILRSETRSIEALINDAETAMVYAKAREDGAYAYYADHMDAKARELLNIETGLRTAIERDEIFVVYQPKVDLQSGKIVGAEALVRWIHPEYGFISPEDFIPLAENLGLIVSIGEWVLREACLQAKAWQDAGHPDFTMAVNVSIRQLREKNFIQTVARALAASGLSPKSLTLELTENMIMENAERNIVRLRALKAIGTRLAIDDFGTGYSSLSYLQRFPLDQLKIDRSFILEIENDNDRAPIVKAVTSLAHDLDMEVVVEGVETAVQLEHVKALGCEQYQGYFCSKPIVAEEFVRLLSGQSGKAA